MYTFINFATHLEPSLTHFDRFVSPTLLDRDLRGAKIATANNGRPAFNASGQHAIIATLTLPSGKSVAIRILKKWPVESAISDRLIPLSVELAKLKTPILTSYRYCDPGIMIQTDEEVDAIGAEPWTPFVVMDWIEGNSLGSFLGGLCSVGDRKGIQDLFTKWIELSREMLRLGFAHGDITASNVMVRSDDVSLVLVDYDDLWLPQVPHPLHVVPGTPGYQNPNERQRKYDPHMDVFSLLVVTVSIAALAQNPAAFGVSDFPFFDHNSIADIRSPAFDAIRSLIDPRARAFGALLDRAWHRGSADVLHDFERLLFADEVRVFEDALAQRRRSDLQRASLPLRMLSLWSEYEMEYENVVDRASEKAMGVLQLAIASEYADWIRQACANRHVNVESLSPELRRRMDDVLSRA
jgi:serine/threonine protein kinase